MAVISIGQLSRQEFECVRLVAQARTNQQIAAALDISVRSVEQYLSRIHRKLGLDVFPGNPRVRLAQIYWQETSRER